MSDNHDEIFPGQNSLLGEPSQNSSLYQAHPLYFFADATLYLKARDSTLIYGVYKGIFKSFSAIFSDCLSLPPEVKEGQPVEGTAFENPVVLPVDQHRLDVLCSFLFHLGWKDEIGRNVTDLIVLGEIAQMYNIPDALKYAIYNLRYHRNFHRGIRVQYACTFGIPNWGLQGTKEILASSAGVGAEMDKAKLENDVVGILYAGQANQRFYTHLLANTIPKIDDDPSWVSCPSKKACQKILARGWSDVIVPALKVNMESLVHLQVIIELKVIGNPDIMQDPDPAFSSMHSTCRRALCDRVDQVVTRISDFIGEETGNMVKDYIKKKHPQVHDNEGWVI